MAVLIALSIEKARGEATHLDQYVVLCLCFGAYYFQVLAFIWRIITGFDKYLNPTRWTPIAPKVHIKIYSQLLVTAILVLQFIFWAKVPDQAADAESGCEQ